MDIVTILKQADYEVVEGGENVKKAILEAAGPSQGPLCSGWRIFPDGTRCQGCADCKKV